MAGVKGKSGRKKTVSRLIAEYLESIKDDCIVEAINTIREKVRKGDSDAAEYMLNRFLGTPHQSIDHRVKGKLVLSPEEYIQLDRDIDELKEAETKLLSETIGLGDPSISSYNIEDNEAKL